MHEGVWVAGWCEHRGAWGGYVNGGELPEQLETFSGAFPMILLMGRQHRK